LLADLLSRKKHVNTNFTPSFNRTSLNLII
jgi:hypothetical protein